MSKTEKTEIHADIARPEDNGCALGPSVSELAKSKTTKEQIEKVAMAIAGVRWDKVERPAGNTQGREDYSYYLKDCWLDEAKAAIEAMK